MKESTFLNYSAEIKKEGEHIEELKQLTIYKQKQHLIKNFDNNQLYLIFSRLIGKILNAPKMKNILPK